MAFEASSVFSRMLASAGTPVYSLQPDTAVLIYLATAVVLTACFAGLSPAAESLRVDLAAAMKTGEGWSGTGRALNRRHGVLVAAQVAMSLLLLVTRGPVHAWPNRRAFTANPGLRHSTYS